MIVFKYKKELAIPVAFACSCTTECSMFITVTEFNNVKADLSYKCMLDLSF